MPAAGCTVTARERRLSRRLTALRCGDTVVVGGARGRALTTLYDGVVVYDVVHPFDVFGAVRRADLDAVIPEAR